MWTANELRQLRYRMGWTQAEMARSVGCGLEIVVGWELGQGLPDLGQKNILIRFSQQASSNSERTMRRPVAEFLMSNRGLTQIHDAEVIECLADGVLAHMHFKS